MRFIPIFFSPLQLRLLTALRSNFIESAWSETLNFYRSWIHFHSDRGVQYACDVLRQKLAELKFLQSMSAKGHCYDSASMESFFQSFKTELVYQTTFKTIAEAKTTFFEWTEAFYYRERILSSIG